MQRENCNRDKAYSMTMKSGPAEYSRRLRGICESSNSPSNKENHIIFLDKNHPKDAVSKIISEISSNLPKNVHAKFVYLIPKIERKAYVYGLPLSASFLLQTMSRCQSRSEHHTLDNKDPLALIEIQIMFMLLNKGLDFDQTFLLHTGLDGFLQLPMSNEQVVIPDDLINSLL
jgi:hypothetical protein